MKLAVKMKEYYCSLVCPIGTMGQWDNSALFISRKAKPFFSRGMLLFDFIIFYALKKAKPFCGTEVGLLWDSTIPVQYQSCHGTVPAPPVYRDIDINRNIKDICQVVRSHENKKIAANQKQK